MGERVVRTARATGTPESDVPLLEQAHALAMEPRLGAGLDAHDPDFLHPGRSALILLLDSGEARGEVLAAAMLTESRRPELAADLPRVREALGPGAGAAVAERVARVPLPDAEDLAERLLLAEPDVQLVALAERLDHLRHAHLWHDVEASRAAHASAARVYARIAERVHPALARRYRWWCDMFERNYLR
jgi:(p)ppGpp synthase/HD superfamily hydrolase